MREVILLVGHGSRHKPGNDEIEVFAEQWRTRKSDARIELCFIEFADIMLDQGLSNAAQDADRVIVVPLILNAAGHVKMEIPAHIAKARKRHPQVEFIYAKHLGANDHILSIMQQQLRQVMNQLDVPDPKTTGVIVLARGSSDRVANGEVAKIARWIYEVSDHENVDIAFTGITHPRLENTVQKMHKLGMSQIVILPYYLFTGTLIERIKRQTEHLRQVYPGMRFGLGNYFGFSEQIFHLLDERVMHARGDLPEESIMMECDGCNFRQIAEDNGHGHHHHDHGHDHEHHHHHEEQPA